MQLVVAAAFVLLPQHVQAQKKGLLDRLRDDAGRVKEKIQTIQDLGKDGKNLVGRAKSLGCTARGVSCASVESSADFKAKHYRVLAVAFASKESRGQPGDIQQLVRDMFESAIVRRGFTAAPGADARRIQERIDQGPDAPEAKQEQLRDFASSIDAVLLVEAGAPTVTTCQRTEGGRQMYAQEVGMSMSVRWLNTDAPDIPWIATHQVVTCHQQYATALSDALAKLAADLAEALPERLPKPSDK